MHSLLPAFADRWLVPVMVTAARHARSRLDDPRHSLDERAVGAVRPRTWGNKAPRTGEVLSRKGGKMLKVTSPAFEAGGKVPRKYTGEG